MKAGELYSQVPQSHLAQWWMNVKEKRAVNIIAAHLPKVSLIPAANEP